MHLVLSEDETLLNLADLVDAGIRCAGCGQTGHSGCACSCLSL